MAVRITDIQIQKWGPINRFSLKPGLVNLIYGRNEQGKTFLVEFILRTLFGAGKQWRMRRDGQRQDRDCGHRQSDPVLPIQG